MSKMQDSQTIVVKKQKKVKSKLSDDTIIFENTTNIKSCEEKCVLQKKRPKLSDDTIILDDKLIVDNFIKQERRIDILKNMLNYKHLTGVDLFNKIMLDNKDSNDEKNKEHLGLNFCFVVIECQEIIYNNTLCKKLTLVQKQQ